MMMFQGSLANWAEQLFSRFLRYEQCVDRLTLSFCMGVYIAFCPFVGFHTALVFLFAWLFALNFAVMLSVSMLVNNPWTMVPVYGAGHVFGDWVLSFFGMDHYEWNPSWITSLNSWARESIGLHGFSFWAFMIGGNILGVAFGALCYPLIKPFFIALKQRGAQKVKQTMDQSKRAAKRLAQKAQPIIKRVKARVKQKRHHEDHHAK